MDKAGALDAAAEPLPVGARHEAFKVHEQPWAAAQLADDAIDQRQRIFVLSRTPARVLAYSASAYQLCARQCMPVCHGAVFSWLHAGLRAQWTNLMRSVCLCRTQAAKLGRSILKSL